MDKKPSTHMLYIPIAMAIAALLFFIALWQFSQEQRFTLFFINKAVATTAVGLIGLSYLMGPLVKVIPPLRPHLHIRKYVGIYGFIAVIIHIFTTILQYNDRISLKWYIEHFWGFVAAVIAALIFLRLYGVSNDKAYSTLGHNNWKRIQRFGYVGIIFTLLHIYIAAQARWEMFFKGDVAMPLSLKIFSFLIIVLVVRLLWIGVDRLFPKK